MQRVVLVSFLCFTSLLFFAQAERNQELLKLIKSTNNDSLKCFYLNELIENETDNSVWPTYNADLKTITLKHIDLEKGKDVNKYYLSKYADVLVNEGFLLQQNSKLSEALQLYKTALDIKLDLKNRKESSVILINIGFLFQETADYVKAYKYYKRALAIQEEMNDKENAAITLMNLASISLHQDDTSQYTALVVKALEYRTGVNDKRGMARCYNALAVIEGNKADRKKAFEYLKKAIMINEELSDKEGIGNSYNNMGGLYFREGDLKQSYNYYSKAYKANIEVEDNGSASTSLKNLGDISFKRKNFQGAHEYYSKALDLAQMSGNIITQQNAALGLVRSSEALGLKKQLNSYSNLAEKLRDSLEKKVSIPLVGLTRLLDPDSNIIPAPLVDPIASAKEAPYSYSLILLGGIFSLIFILIILFFIKRKKGST